MIMKYAVEHLKRQALSREAKPINPKRKHLGSIIKEAMNLNIIPIYSPHRRGIILTTCPKCHTYRSMLYFLPARAANVWFWRNRKATLSEVNATLNKEKMAVGKICITEGCHHVETFSQLIY